MFLKGTKPKTKHVMHVIKRNTNSLIKLDQSSHFEAHVSDLTDRRKLPTARGRKCPNCQVFALPDANNNSNNNIGLDFKSWILSGLQFICENKLKL